MVWMDLSLMELKQFGMVFQMNPPMPTSKLRNQMMEYPYCILIQGLTQQKPAHCWAPSMMGC